MSTRVIHELIDDIDGTVATESVTFGLDGVVYEIDLSAKNAAKLREALKAYVTAGRKQSNRVAVVARPGGRAASGYNSPKGETAKARAWARANRIDVPERGVLRPDVLEAYRRSLKAPAVPTQAGVAGRVGPLFQAANDVIASPKATSVAKATARGARAKAAKAAKAEAAA